MVSRIKLSGNSVDIKTPNHKIVFATTEEEKFPRLQQRKLFWKLVQHLLVLWHESPLWGVLLR